MQKECVFPDKHSHIITDPCACTKIICSPLYALIQCACARSLSLSLSRTHTHTHTHTHTKHTRAYVRTCVLSTDHVPQALQAQGVSCGVQAPSQRRRDTMLPPRRRAKGRTGASRPPHPVPPLLLSLRTLNPKPRTLNAESSTPTAESWSC